jgi:hypothetical protein
MRESRIKVKTHNHNPNYRLQIHNLFFKTGKNRHKRARMSQKEKMTSIWISWDTYRKILKVKAKMMKTNGKTRNPDEVIKEIIEFWNKHQP